MKSQWPIVPFSSIMTKIDRKFIISDGEEYQRIGVRWYGMGAFVRDSAFGMDIARKQQWRVEQDDVIYNKLFAWKGAFAVAGQEVHGHIASDKFPTYRHDASRLDLDYLRYYFRSPIVAEQAAAMSKGGAAISKFTLNPPQFWDLTIPLPPLDEQRRIVARIDALAARIAEAQALRAEALAEAENTAASVHRQYSNHQTVRMGQILDLDENQVSVENSGIYPQVGIRGFGAGLFFRETLSGSETSYRHFNRLYQGALVLSQVKGWEGAAAVCSSEFAGHFVSPEYRTFRCREELLLSDYLKAVVPTKWFLSKLTSITRGMGARRQRVRPEQFLELEITIPTIDLQHKAVAMFRKLDAVKDLQAVTQAELDALLPAVLDRAFKGEL